VESDLVRFVLKSRYQGMRLRDLLNDILPDDLNITWPTWRLCWITQNGKVIDKSIYPDVYRLLEVVGDRYTPRDSTPRPGNRKVLERIE